VQALELGFDGVLLNTAIAKASDPVLMAQAFKYALKAGEAAHQAGVIVGRKSASASTPVVGTPFWNQF